MKAITCWFRGHKWTYLHTCTTTVDVWEWWECARCGRTESIIISSPYQPAGRLPR